MFKAGEITITASTPKYENVASLGATKAVDYKIEKFDSVLSDYDLVLDNTSEWRGLATPNIQSHFLRDSCKCFLECVWLPCVHVFINYYFNECNFKISCKCARFAILVAKNRNLRPCMWRFLESMLGRSVHENYRRMVTAAC